jgi:hypothetical protein
MSDFLATVLAKAVVMLIEALIVRLIRALFAPATSASAQRTAPVAIAA